jgi:hypothetical protein
MIAKAMNFTYVYQRPEPMSTWGAQLPNGSWTALIGKISALIILPISNLATLLIILNCLQRTEPDTLFLRF